MHILSTRSYIRCEYQYEYVEYIMLRIVEEEGSAAV